MQKKITAVANLQAASLDALRLALALVIHSRHGHDIVVAGLQPRHVEQRLPGFENRKLRTVRS